MPPTARRKTNRSRAKAAADKKEKVSPVKKAVIKKGKQHAPKSHKVRILNPAQAVLVSMLRRAGWRIINLETLLKENDKKSRH